MALFPMPPGLIEPFRATVRQIEARRVDRRLARLTPGDRGDGWSARAQLPNEVHAEASAAVSAALELKSPEGRAMARKVLDHLDAMEEAGEVVLAVRRVEAQGDRIEP